MRTDMYRWFLSINDGAKVTASPIYKDDIALIFQRETN